MYEESMLTPPRVKNINLGSYKTDVHLFPEVPHDIPEVWRLKPIKLLLSSGFKAPINSFGKSKHTPVAYSGTPADIIIIQNIFVFLFTTFRWCVENWEIEYVRFDYSMDKYGLVTISITLKDLYSVLPCWKIPNKKWSFANSNQSLWIIDWF